MTNQEELTQYREQLEGAIRLKDLILKLERSPAYREVVVKGFCTDECARYVEGSVNPALDEASRKLALQCAQAAGCFRNWIAAQKRMGMHAESQLRELDEEMRAVEDAQEAEEIEAQQTSNN